MFIVVLPKVDIAPLGANCLHSLKKRVGYIALLRSAESLNGSLQ